MNRTTRHEIFSRLQAANPHPRTELVFEGPFQLLIAVLLSAQTTDVAVNKVTAVLFALGPTPQAMLALGEEVIRDTIKTIGLYKTKAAHVVATCEKLLNHFGGVVPDTREALETLPGVGRKTANVVLNTAFGQPTMAVDTHIFRVGNRTGMAKGKNVREVEDQLLKHIPKQFMVDAHHWLILHGRYTCKALKPQCGQCLIEDLCDYKAKAL